MQPNLTKSPSEWNAPKTETNLANTPANVLPTGKRIEYATASATVSATSWASISVTWAKSFASIDIALASVRAPSGDQSYGFVTSFSTTGLTMRVYNSVPADITMYVDAIGIGS